ncbi:MAG: SpoIID/LytB domain-containing protein [Fermentimonas sp.]|nr:SpoIID/LytB domain-containing protein [Fermentimonas sp.]HBT85643.1 amidase [Porphyromonadaceae bacterium]MDD2930963.1 SpoIID/LytB domain-containing protein [Fermentimonas sp.]MDD3188344.1 SpoIID/LytB domain-containing protein [Fermentimonas sp.]MDD3510965.1 SpoIID/LytB domain-containing protein [Fermentimonas sp.]
MKEPLIHVGVLQNQKKIKFSLLSAFKLQGKEYPKGDYYVEIENGLISFNGNKYDQLTFEANQLHGDKFEIKDVIIGVQFHWERKENQQFLGGLKFIATGEGIEKTITAINIISLEDYLKSVISSEMSSTNAEELLKAHAIISRSWLLAQIIKSQTLKKEKDKYRTSIETPTEIIRWYDREDHEHFDVCADDHCQRYQGITRQTTELVNRVVNETYGKVISYQGSICDARFSKCCGGIMETFENVWEPIIHPYLQGKPDNYSEFPIPDLCREEEAEDWIRNSPDAFCNTQNKQVLKQVLNDYDQETTDFFRWKVTYNQEELTTLIKKHTGINFGQIIDLQPLERGTSGRINRLKIIGTERVMVIGKELEIRRILSNTHLYSSAFVVDAFDEDSDGIPQKFILTGAGWGHGVGLCQIGASMMAEKGYKHKEILAHYYPNSKIQTKY